MPSRAGCLIAAAFAFSFPFAPLAWAQAWPTKPIRLIVNFPPGGTTDLMARALGPRLGEVLGQPIAIDNRGGAAGNIGLEAVVKSARTATRCSSRPAVPLPSARTCTSSASNIRID